MLSVSSDAKVWQDQRAAMAFASGKFFVGLRVFLMRGALENALQPAHVVYASEQI